MSAMLRLWAFAFSRSMVMVYCGSSLRPFGAHRDQPRVLGRRSQQLVAHRHQLVVAGIVLVQQLEIEAGGVAEFQHRGRREGEHLRVLDLS